MLTCGNELDRGYDFLNSLAAVQCASEENSPPVDFEAAACGLELPEAEFDRF